MGNELPKAELPEKAMELLRVWHLPGGKSKVSLRLGAWNALLEVSEEDETVENEAIAWGMMLADIARHVAEGLHQAAGVPHQLVLESIAEAYGKEMSDMGDHIKGLIQGAKDAKD